MNFKYLKLNQRVKAQGCITEYKSIKGVLSKPLQLAQTLGLSHRLLKEGYVVLQLCQLPGPSNLALGGYNQVQAYDMRKKIPKSWSDSILPKVMEKFNDIGPSGLVKVVGFYKGRKTAVDYPIGPGIPQWILTSPVEMRVLAYKASRHAVLSAK